MSNFLNSFSVNPFFRPISFNPFFSNSNMFLKLDYGLSGDTYQDKRGKRQDLAHIE